MIPSLRTTVHYLDRYISYALESGLGPSLPPPTSAGHGSYLGISCRRWGPRTSLAALIKEPGDAADPITRKREHDQPRGLGHAIRVDKIAAKCGLGIGAHWAQGEPSRGPCQGDTQERGDRSRSAVLVRRGWHAKPRVVGEQRDDAVDVAGGEGVGE